MAPVIRLLQAQDWVTLRVATTAQHREMCDQALKLFDIVPDHDFDLMSPDQSLNDVAARVLLRLDGVFADAAPDAVIGQGDTTSAMASAMASFHRNIPFFHIEAGLRSHNIALPFPEEFNRVVIGRIAALHFAPTERARQNLLREGVDPRHIMVTGNTVIDALHMMLAMPGRRDAFGVLSGAQRRVLVTAHRRESVARPLDNICRAVQRLIEEYPDIHVLWPVHPNPNIAGPIHRTLSHVPRIQLVPPIEYDDFVMAMNDSCLILTDSGGVQEEAAALGVPVLVLRDVTERVEGLDAGSAILVGTDVETILAHAREILDKGERAAVRPEESPYGDGQASERIVAAIKERLVPPAASGAA